MCAKGSIEFSLYSVFVTIKLTKTIVRTEPGPHILKYHALLIVTNISIVLDL